MLKNYLKIVFRTLQKNKVYASINILGLSLGIAASVLIVVFVADELSYDQFHPQSENLYRVDFTGKLNGNEFNMAMTGAPIGPAMAEEIPEVESTLRVGQWESVPIQYEELTFTEGSMLVVEKNFFDFFGFELLQGDPATVLDGPNKIVITEDNARKYFGDEDPIGKILLRGSDKTATEITGVISNPPSNSHLTYDMIISGDSWEYLKNENWSSNNLYTYFRTYPEVDLSNVQASLDGFIEKYFGPEIEQYLGFSMDELRAQGNNVGYGFMPLENIHLYSELSEEPTTPGNIQYLYIFGAISIFIILIACINFMNLATAKSANHAKEVGVRKSIGAGRTSLVGQFLSESMIYSFISGFLALIFILVALQPFNALSGKNLSWMVFLDPILLLGFFAFLFFVGLLAGSYPAFYLTSFSPSEVFKGKVRKGAKRSGFRNGLVIFQFIVSICLIISSLVVYKQLTYMQEVNLGFDKENVINLLHTQALGNNAEAFKQDLLSNTGFVAASFANNLPPKIDWTSVYRAVDTEQDYLFTMNWVDQDHLDAMGYEMVQGRFFSEDFPTDSSALIVNESAFKQIGWTEIDGTQKISGYFDADTNEVREVIGVIKDFNYDNLKLKIEPLIMGIAPDYYQEMAIRLNPGDITDRIALIEELWSKHANGAAFEYSFLDSNFDSLYRSEKNMGNIILVFTVLAISIACLGLFGLAAYTTEQRSKEISIRKAMGATMPHLVTLLSKDFTVLVLIAFVISGPLAYYVMDQYWLQNFAFRTSIGWPLIFGAGMLSILIAWLTVSYQSFKTAASNPVDYLKSE
ncbi:ABC transporter permease [Algoriphagus sp. SE2]|uniref:ABC transporter permease n=1 Tax=Algoriphagus sp. SE2 TaxID=3141536 RepID=UPI0031CDA433